MLSLAGREIAWAEPDEWHLTIDQQRVPPPEYDRFRGGAIKPRPPFHRLELGLTLSLLPPPAPWRAVAFPLCFELRNAGEWSVPPADWLAFSRQGIAHLRGDNGVARDVRFFPRPVSAGAEALFPGRPMECPVYAGLREIFGSVPEGIYRVWWSVGLLRSNELSFAVAGGELFFSDENTASLTREQRETLRDLLREGRLYGREFVSGPDVVRDYDSRLVSLAREADHRDLRLYLAGLALTRGSKIDPATFWDTFDYLDGVETTTVARLTLNTSWLDRRVSPGAR